MREAVAFDGIIRSFLVNDVTLHLLAGQIASGKSTLAKKLSEQYDAIVISEDEWLLQLFADQISTVEDYVRCSTKLKRAMEPHLLGLMQVGLSVVLDFPTNTLKQRSWMRNLIDKAGCEHVLHFLDVPIDICKSRLRLRNQQGKHAFQVTDGQFDVISGYFEAPTSDESFTVIRYDESQSPIPA